MLNPAPITGDTPLKTPSRTHKPKSDARSETRLKITNERLNKQIRRCTDVVGIFPNHEAIIRLVGAVPAEQHNEWGEGCRYMNLEVLNQAQQVGADTSEEVQPQTIEALAA